MWGHQDQGRHVLEPRGEGGGVRDQGSPGAPVTPPRELCCVTLERRVFLTAYELHSQVASSPQTIWRQDQSYNRDAKPPAQWSVRLCTLLGCDVNASPSPGSSTNCWPHRSILEFHNEGHVQYAGRREFCLLGR